MYVCICHAVTDKQVETAVDSGADSVERVAEMTSAGTSCATCHDTVEDLIEARCGTCPLGALAASGASTVAA